MASRSVLLGSLTSRTKGGHAYRSGVEAGDRLFCTILLIFGVLWCLYNRNYGKPFNSRTNLTRSYRLWLENKV